MGQEARCQARVGERVVDVKALLESDELILRCEHRARISFASLDSVETEGGRLIVHAGGEPIVLDLGSAAARWAAKMLHPPTVLDKLGVKDGQRIAVVGVSDLPLRTLLRARVGPTEYDSLERPPWDEMGGAELDILFVQVDRRDDLTTLASAALTIAQAGAIWVIHPKRRPDLKDTDVMAAGKQAGLVDNKVARISETHTALRFVIPKANRRPTASTRR
jgi:hypothetical protein